MKLCLIRHGPTAWNLAGRMQGRADPPLGGHGKTIVRGWRVPEGFAGARWISSPLRRARETARLIAGREPEIDGRLTEMDWGAFEGRTLHDLRTGLGACFEAMENRGIDFTPPGGESPRMVTARLRELLTELAADSRDAVAVTHKGVIRAALVLATGWDMLQPPPVRLARDHGLTLLLSEGGTIAEFGILPLGRVMA
jgi:broad specificity phosphatase PhoE